MSTTTIAMAAASTSSVRVFMKHDRQADLIALQSAIKRSSSDLYTLLGRCVRSYGAGVLELMVYPPTPLIYEPLPRALYHPQGHLTKPRPSFHNPHYVRRVVKTTENILEDELECVKGLMDRTAATKAGRARALRHPVCQSENWEETATAPIAGIRQLTSSRKIPDVTVTTSDGEIRYLEDRNFYP